MFKTPFVDGERVVLESLFPGIEIASGAIDLFTHVLNKSEQHRNKMTVTRLFCHTSMVVSSEGCRISISFIVFIHKL